MALAHHVSGAFPDATSGQLTTMRMAKTFRVFCNLIALLWIFIDAVQCVFDQLLAVVEQIGAELPTGARQVVQGVEIKLRGKLTHNRITAQGGGESIDIGIGSRILVSCVLLRR